MTHVDVSSFASKTNLASLKTEVDKLDIPKLSAIPADLAKLTNKVANNLVEETDFNALEKKVTDNKIEQENLETTVQNNHLTTESSINGLKTKVDGIDLTKYVKKSDYGTKVGNLELKIPDIGELLQVSTFNSKVGELENKIKTVESRPGISNLATKTGLKNAEIKIPDSNAFDKKTDYATQISGIKNNYVTNAALTSQLNDLKSQHIADEVKKVDDKVSKNITDILGLESRLKQKEDTLNDLEREASFFRGNYYFNHQSRLVYEPRTFSFKQTSSGITHWKSTGIDNYSLKTDLRGVANTSGIYPKVSGKTRMSVVFSGNYVKEKKSIYPTKSAVNIYIVYKLDTIKPTRNTDFTIQNALFGAVKITEDPLDSSHNKHSGYGICFDKSSDFDFGNIVNGKNVILFGADMSFSSQERNRQKKFMCWEKILLKE